MKTSLRLEGGEQLAKVLNTLPSRLSTKVVRDALRTAGEPMRARAAFMAPREPGAPDLADHIGMSTAFGPDREPAIAIGPTKNFFYGTFQEWGTSRHGAQPFMRPSFDGEVKATVLRVRGEIWAALISRGFGSGRGGGGGTGL